MFIHGSGKCPLQHSFRTWSLLSQKTASYPITLIRSRRKGPFLIHSLPSSALLTEWIHKNMRICTSTNVVPTLIQPSEMRCFHSTEGLWNHGDFPNWGRPGREMFSGLGMCVEGEVGCCNPSTMWKGEQKMFLCMFFNMASLGNGEGNGTPLQYSCLENPMDRGAWKAAVRRVTKRQIQLKWLRTDGLYL